MGNELIMAIQFVAAYAVLITNKNKLKTYESCGYWSYRNGWKRAITSFA
jgi:hypothetical protein